MLWLELGSPLRRGEKLEQRNLKEKLNRLDKENDDDAQSRQDRNARAYEQKDMDEFLPQAA